MRNDIVAQAEAIRASMNVAGEFLTDEQAATVAVIYPHWIVGETVKPGDRRYYVPNGKLYKVNEGQGHTTQSDWTPDITPAMWSVIDVSHAGTIDDPLPASRGMEYEYGKYYLDPEDNQIYLCKRGEETGTIVLQYLPHEVVGNYFELA